MAFNAMAVKIIRLPLTPNNGKIMAINCGIMMGPSPVNVHAIPVAIRRFSLKYVLSASDEAEEFIPEPAPISNVIVE